MTRNKRGEENKSSQVVSWETTTNRQTYTQKKKETEETRMERLGRRQQFGRRSVDPERNGPRKKEKNNQSINRSITHAVTRRRHFVIQFQFQFQFDVSQKARGKVREEREWPEERGASDFGLSHPSSQKMGLLAFQPLFIVFGPVANGTARSLRPSSWTRTHTQQRSTKQPTYSLLSFLLLPNLPFLAWLLCCFPTTRLRSYSQYIFFLFFFSPGFVWCVGECVCEVAKNQQQLNQHGTVSAA